MIRLALRVRREDADRALAELLEHAPSGVEEVDLGDRVEFAIYGPPGELPALPDLQAAVGGSIVEVVTQELPDDWHERWREFHRPIDLGELRVRAPWHDATDRDLVIDPGQAFGTGAHDTTRLCLELLLALPAAARTGAVSDVGCGSGVLAIAAAKLGFDPVVATDFDPLAVEATVDNARVNQVSLQVARHDLLRDGPAPGAPLVLANLLRPLLLRVAADGFADGFVPERLVISGLLRGEADEVAGAFTGYRELDRREGGEWAAVLLQRAG